MNEWSELWTPSLMQVRRRTSLLVPAFNEFREISTFWDWSNKFNLGDIRLISFIVLPCLVFKCEFLTPIALYRLTETSRSWLTTVLTVLLEKAEVCWQCSCNASTLAHPPVFESPFRRDRMAFLLNKIIIN